jgi:hypothetical protein
MGGGEGSMLHAILNDPLFDEIREHSMLQLKIKGGGLNQELNQG